MKVSFVGAGPGDPDLITVKGKRLLEEADLVVYAGSLVNPQLLAGLKAELMDSNGQSLQATCAAMAATYYWALYRKAANGNSKMSADGYVVEVRHVER